MSSENRDRQWWAVTIGVLALVYLIGAVTEVARGDR